MALSRWKTPLYALAIGSVSVAICGCVGSDDADSSANKPNLGVNAYAITTDHCVVEYHNGRLTRTEGEQTLLLSISSTADEPSLEGGDSIICLLFNRQIVDSMVAKGDSEAVKSHNLQPTEQDSTLAADLPYGAEMQLLNLWLDSAISNPDSARAALNQYVAGGSIVTPPCGYYNRPIIAPNYAYALAVADVAMMTGLAATDDAKRIAQLLDSEATTTYDSSLRLYCGASPSFVQVAPAEMNAADFAAQYSFRANVERVAALKFLSRYNAAKVGSLDSLSEAVETWFRIPTTGGYSALLYGAPYAIQSTLSDNLANALAVATGAVGGQTAEMLMTQQPAVMLPNLQVESASNFPTIATYYPMPKGGVDGAEASVAAAVTAIAAARVGNGALLSAAFAQTIREAAASTTDAQSLRAVILRAIFGINPTHEGLEIKPFLPQEISGDITLRGLRYRDATLDISLHGSGNIISTFSIDGKVSSQPLIHPDTSGRHEIKITLVGESHPDAMYTTASYDAAPATPSVTFDSNNALSFSSKDAEKYRIYAAGAAVLLTDKNAYSAPLPKGDNRTEHYAVVPISGGGVEGFAPRAVYSQDKENAAIIEASSIATTGTRVFKDKRLNRQYANKFVESTRYKNGKISFTFEAPAAGCYYVSLTYVDGLGIVNPERRYALRMLTVNGRDVQLLVLPQLKPDNWAYHTKWWERVGESLPVPVELSEGANELSLNYFSPNWAGLTDDANLILPIQFNIAAQ